MKRLEPTKHKNGVGITITDIHLSNELPASLIFEIQELLNKHRLVVFKNQTLTDDELIDFAFRFGPPFTPDHKFPVLGSQDSNSSIVIVGNQANEYSKSYLGHQEVLPHSDHQWLKCPSAASLLYAIDIHQNSAPTIWFDMVKAYETLDIETKMVIEKLNLITYNPFYRPFGSVSSFYVNRDKDLPPGDIFPHPVIRTHPLTKEKILYMNIAYEVEFENFPHELGEKLFEKLSEHILKLDFKYEHHWNNGDIVMWDNRATIHYRPAFNSDVRRVLKRITLGGEMPF
jgi:taurine dioxygenase